MTNKHHDHSKEQKKLVVRLDEDTDRILNQLCTNSGETKSEIIRSLIHHGTINVLTNGNELVKFVNKFNNTINQHNLQLSQEIRHVQTDINSIKQVISQQNTPNPVLLVYLAKAETYLDHLFRKYQEEIYRISDYATNRRTL